MHPSHSEFNLTLLAPDRYGELERVENRDTNRNFSPDAPCQISARNDFEAFSCWLLEYQASPETFRSYAKEVRRLMRYSTMIANKPVSSWNRQDFLAYEVFLANPQPHNDWCGPSRPWDAPDWKPFRDKLAQSSVTHAMGIISSAMDWLVQAGYLRSNPLKLSRLKTRKSRLKSADGGSGHTEKVFSVELYEQMVKGLNQVDFGARLPDKRKARAKFMLAFLFELAPRISELVGAQFSDFKPDVSGQWFWTVRGKGAKLARLPLSDSMLRELGEYRNSLGLPSSNAFEKLPCLQVVGKALAVKPMDTSSVHKELKWLLKQFSALLCPANPGLEALFKQISAHWFRHSAITEVYGLSNDIRLTAEFARHESIQTTMRYSHVSSDELRQLANLRKKPK